MHWVTVDGLERHWEQAKVDAKINDHFYMNVSTNNVSALTLTFPKGNPIFGPDSMAPVKIDGEQLGLAVAADGSRTSSFRKVDGTWKLATSDRRPALEADGGIRPSVPRSSRTTADPGPGLRKRHGLQGPIDDAFMDSFMIVKPSRPAINAKLEEWTKHEVEYASNEWRKIFRGVAREKNDHELTDADIASNNLVLFGDPSSNAVIAKVVDRLPIKWTKDAITLPPVAEGTAARTFPAASHALIAIYPNPLNPARYVVLNSGFTFRQADHKTNSRQVAKLPDWAVIDLATPPDDQAPGGVAAAGFFGEGWEFKGK
jgi:hypothetical protein